MKSEFIDFVIVFIVQFSVYMFLHIYFLYYIFHCFLLLGVWFF